MSFNITLPVNPSLTITSHAPFGTSRASIFPMKLILLPSSSGYTSFVISVPLPSSAPRFTSPTVGFSLPITFSIYTLPIIACWRRFCGLQSGFAPASIKSEGIPPRMGYMLAMHGLSIPSSFPSIILDATTIAPVFPAETNKSPLPPLSIERPTTSEESGFFLTVLTGLSSFVITSFALTTVTCSGLYLYFERSSFIRSSFPTIHMSCLISSEASTAPLTISSGALSPPIPSSIIFNFYLRDVVVSIKCIFKT